MAPDYINALFETVGAVFVWCNFFRLNKDREIKGVLWHVTAFYAVWGAWNVVYYPALGQWYSAVAGVILCAGNIAWVVFALCLRIQRGKPA